jgi:hypothetical protein
MTFEDEDIEGQNMSQATEDTSVMAVGVEENVEETILEPVEASGIGPGVNTKAPEQEDLEARMNLMVGRLKVLETDNKQTQIENERMRRQMDEIHQRQEKPDSIVVAVQNEPNRIHLSKNALFCLVFCMLVLIGGIVGGVVASQNNSTTSASSVMTDDSTGTPSPLAPSTESTPAPAPTFTPTVTPTLAPSVPALPTVTPVADDYYSVEGVTEILEHTFTVESIEGEGRYFSLSYDQFPIAISGLENDRLKTTIRVYNSRTAVIKGVMMELSPETGTIRGNYNPAEYTNPNDFQVGDELVAVDYAPMLPGKACVRQEFGIVGVNRDLGWNVAASNIRIGRFGVVGGWYADFEYTFFLETPVTTLWSDAVGIEIEYSTGSWYSQLTPRADNPALRDFDAPVSGVVHVTFKDASFQTLNGLVTQRDAGGLHVAFCM